MQFKYENQGANTYLVYKVGQDDTIDSMSLGMLTNNKIDGFVPVVFTQLNTTKYLKYNISTQVSVKQLFGENAKKQQIIAVFSGIVDALLAAEDYMIDHDLIILDLDYIFADVLTCETKVVCLPIVRSNTKSKEPKLFFKHIMFNTQFDASENGDYVAKIMNYLNSDRPFSLKGFKALLDEIKGEKIKSKSHSPQKAEKTVEPIKQQEIPKPISRPITIPQQSAVTEKKDELQDVEEKQISLFYLLQHYNKENAALYKAQREARKKLKEEQNLKITKKSEQKKDNSKMQAGNIGFAIPGQENAIPSQDDKSAQYKSMGIINIETEFSDILQGEEMDFGETVLLEDEMTEGTIYLGEEEQEKGNVPYLLRIINNEKIDINKDIFRIGKDAIYADYYIKNPAISHKHAYIIRRGEEFFIVDTDSKNHTYVDGRKIESNTETKLEHGTKICLAKEEFEFRLY